MIIVIIILCGSDLMASFILPSFCSTILNVSGFFSGIIYTTNREGQLKVTRWLIYRTKKSSRPGTVKSKKKKLIEFNIYYCHLFLYLLNIESILRGSVKNGERVECGPWSASCSSLTYRVQSMIIGHISFVFSINQT